LKDRKLRITRKNELITMEELAKEEKAIRNRLEPLGFGSDKTKLWAEYAQSPMMLRALEEVRTYLMNKPKLNNNPLFL
jgi:hypothetical protein